MPRIRPGRFAPRGAPDGAGQLVEIRNSENLKRWLMNRPREDAVAIAARAALRVAPLLMTALDEDTEARRAAIVLPVFRALAASWVAAVGPTQGAKVRKAAYAAATDAAATRTTDAAAHAAYAATHAAHATTAVAHAYAATHAARAAAAADAAADAAARDATNAAAFAAVFTAAAWSAASVEAAALEKGQAPERVVAMPLWSEEMPVRMRITWAELQDHLNNANEGWEVWTDWYEDRLHGRPFNKPLEEARVLIPDEIWKQGPKAVNAEIKRLIEEHKPKPPPAPDLPDQRPTPIRFEFRDGALHRAPPEPPHPPEERRAAAESAWQANRDMLNDYLTSGGGGQNPRLATVLHRCLGAMGEEFEALDVVLLGVHSARLQGFADRADEVLIPEDAAELVTLNVQLALFLAQFPEWADYASGIGDGFGTPQAEQQAVADATAALDQIQQDAPGLIAPDAQEGLTQLAEAATPEPTPDVPEPVAPPVERRSLLRAARSALRGLAGKALADVQVGVSKGIQKSAESTTVAAISGVKGYLLALALGLPGEFGWLAAIATYLTRMLGPSSAGKSGKNDDTEGDDDMTDA